MAAFNLFVGASGVVFIFFILGIHNYLTAHVENSCEMTYMFEYPQYVRISLAENDTAAFPKYALYAYGEGQYTEHLRSMRFSGIPVLFVPGNSGSYRQVRSLASVALRKAKDSRTPFHFNFFTADLNEEHSALFGGVLPEQTRFVSRCIHAILNLYKNSKYAPKTVLLFGHSMGGMVAKGVFLEPDFVPGSVHTVLTLATPHASPVVSLDSYVATFYSRINQYWDNGSEDRLLVSVGGGHRDLLVRSGLTLHGNISTLSTAVPGVWVSADHLCILWCKQLVLALARALFDSVDLKTKQLAADPVTRHKAFTYHLLYRNFGKKIGSTVYPPDIYFDREGEWQEFLRYQFSVTPFHLGRPSYVMIRLMGPQYQKHEMLALEAIALESRDWVFACVADLVYKDIRMCQKGVNLSNLTQFIPSLKKRRKSVHLNLHALKLQGFTHVVARLPASSDSVQLNVDVFSSKERQVQVKTFPQWFSTSPQVIIPSTAEGALYYHIMFPTIERAWHAATLHLETKCKNKKEHHAVMTLETDWSSEDSHAFVTKSVSQPLPLKLHLLRPSSASKDQMVHVLLHLDPTCSYSASLEGSLPMLLGQLVRFYSPQLPAYLVAVLLLTLRTQLAGTAKGQSCMAFHSALATGARPYLLLPLIKTVATILKWGPFGRMFPASDWLVLQSQGLDMLLLPLLLYCVASFTAYILGLAIWVTVVIWGTTANKVIVRFISRSLFGGFQWSEWVLSAFARVPFAVAIILVALAYTTCGALALAAGLCFYFLLVVKMYEDYLEELLKVPLRLLTGRREGIWGRSESHISELHFHSTGLLLWAVTAGLHAPCALAWARSFPFASHLTPDPSLGPALALCVCAPVLWQRQMPRPYLKHYRELDVFLFVLTAVCLVFAPVSLHRLGPFLVMALMLVCFQQLIATSLVPAQEAAPPTINDDEHSLSLEEKEKQA